MKPAHAPEVHICAGLRCGAKHATHGFPSGVEGKTEWFCGTCLPLHRIMQARVAAMAREASEE